MKTTRYVVEYNIPASPSSWLITPFTASLCACLLHSMEVDATCAKDAVQAVLAAHPNASITTVLEERRPALTVEPRLPTTMKGTDK